LLKQYIRYIIRQEGTSYIEYLSSFGEDPLSAEDVAELRRIDAEIGTTSTCYPPLNVTLSGYVRGQPLFDSAISHDEVQARIDEAGKA